MCTAEVKMLLQSSFHSLYMFSGGDFVRGRSKSGGSYAMRHRLILEKYKFDNFKCLQAHIYIPNGYFYLRWAGQTKFTVLHQMISHKKALFKKN